MGLVVDHSTPAPIMRNMAGAMITSRQSDDTNPPEGSSPTNPQFRRTVSEVVHRRLGRPRRALRRVETEQQGAPLRRLEAAPIAPAAPRMQHMALPSHVSLPLFPLLIVGFQRRSRSPEERNGLLRCRDISPIQCSCVPVRSNSEYEQFPVQLGAIHCSTTPS